MFCSPSSCINFGGPLLDHGRDLLAAVKSDAQAKVGQPFKLRSQLLSVWGPLANLLDKILERLPVVVVDWTFAFDKSSGKAYALFLDMNLEH